MHGPRAQVFTEENSGLPWNLASFLTSQITRLEYPLTGADPVASAEVIYGPRAPVFTGENSGLPWNLASLFPS